MNKALRPRAPLMAGNGAGVWAVLLITWSLAGAAWLAWLAARIAAALVGRHIPPFSERWVISLIRWRTGQAWPGTPTLLVSVIDVVLACAVIAAGITAWRAIAARIPQPGDPVAALAVNPQIAPLTPVPAAETAIRLRPSLAGADPRTLPASRDRARCSATSSGRDATGPRCSPPGKTRSPRSWPPARARPRR